MKQVYGISKKVGLQLLFVLFIALILPLAGEARTVKVASLQMHCTYKDLDANYAKLEALVDEAASQGARLIVAPEMATSGYTFNDRQDVSPYTQTAQEVEERIQPMAARNNCYIALGFPERDPETDILYNSSALIGPEGLVGVYRKIHLWTAPDAYWSTWGNLGVPVFKTDIGEIAMIICMDSCYFETFRLAALNGANIVAFMTNSSGGAIANLQTRAAENGIFIVSSNRSDEELGFRMNGCSAIWDPMGNLLAEADTDSETIVYAEIEPGWSDLVKGKILAERRPELYMNLVLHPSPWDYRVNYENRKLHILTLQFEPLQGDPEANIEIIERILGQAAKDFPADTPRLVVLPELALAGNRADMTKEIARNVAETYGAGYGSRAIARLARQYDCTISFGFVEIDGGNLYNSVGVVDSNGKFLGCYRKTHLDRSDRIWAKPGDHIGVINTEWGRLGIMIGRDAFFPEVSTSLAIDRAEVTILATASPLKESMPIRINPAIHPKQSGADCIWDSRARDNLFYVAVSDAVDIGSGIYGMDPVYGLDEPHLASLRESFASWTVDLHPEWWYTQKEFMGARRKDSLYYPLVRPYSKHSGELPFSLNADPIMSR